LVARTRSSDGSAGLAAELKQLVWMSVDALSVSSAERLTPALARSL
jgi:hypothetical protein